MKTISPSRHLIRKWAPALLAASSVAACTPATTGFDAGGPSSHTPQSYETLTSAAASTSTLGGAAFISGFNLATAAVIKDVATVSGSITHDTGRLELNDGLFLFVDADGADANGVLGVGSSVSGVVGENFTGNYQYVMPYSLSYSIGSTSYSSTGIAGIVSATSDMPTGGTNTYSGESYASQEPTNGVGTYYDLNGGSSTVAVDFAAGTADVTLGSFTSIVDRANPVAPAAAPFDEVRGTGVVLNGVNFSGGSWVTVSGGVVVNVAGANTTATANGTFFGYDPSISAPDEVGGVIMISGDSNLIVGTFIAD